MTGATRGGLKLITVALLAVALPATAWAAPTVSLRVTSGGKPSTRTFETLPAALAGAKAARAKNPNAPLKITLSAPVYRLDAPLVIGPELSGKPGAPTEIVAKAGLRPELRASRLIKTSWKPHKHGVWVTSVQGADFSQIWVNDKRQVLARYPNYDPAIKPLQGFAADALAKARTDRWSHPEEAVVRAIHYSRWGGISVRVTGRNSDGSLALARPVGNNRIISPQDLPHSRYRFVEGVFEELDAAGEWYFDKRTRQLFYKPAPDVDMTMAQVEVSTSPALVRVTGTEAAPVRDVVVSGLAFTRTEDTSLSAVEPMLRSDWKIARAGAVYIERAENVSILDSDFHDLEGQGVFVSGYNRGVTIKGNAFWDMGGTAISFIGLPTSVRSPSFEYAESVPLAQIDRTPGPKSPDYPAQSAAVDNLIHDVGRIDKQAAGINIDMAMDIRLAHNSIYDLPRAGINIGDGAFGGHILEHNDVFETVLETGDHGAFNAWGRDRFWRAERNEMDASVAAEPGLILLDAIKPVIMRYNRWRSDHGWDVDLDDGASNYEIYGNVMLNGGLKLREGFHRKVHDNIMINNSFHPHVWFRNSGDSFERNIVFIPYQPIRIPDWPKEKVNRNFFATTAALEAARKLGVDADSLAGEPEFVDPAKGDYRVKPTSPALKLGFVNPPMEFGVQSPRLRARAKTPKPPEMKLAPVQAAGATADLFGATVKSVETLGEQSAAGLPDISGVMILAVAPKSPAERAGLQVGDVILKTMSGPSPSLQDRPLKALPDLLAHMQAVGWHDSFWFQIQRQQAQRAIILAK